ncbi:hypothetical protein [Roseomonas genomospecies 6]|nr:hypothetical protein [Roseomonas genomospecies 6]
MRAMLVTGIDLWEHERSFKMAFWTALFATGATVFLLATGGPGGGGGGGGSASPPPQNVFATQQPMPQAAPQAPQMPAYQPVLSGPGAPMPSGPVSVTPVAPSPSTVIRGAAPSAQPAQPQPVAPRQAPPTTVKPLEGF